MRDLERGIVRNREKDHENQIEIDGIADTEILSVFRVSYSSSPDSSASFFHQANPPALSRVVTTIQDQDLEEGWGKHGDNDREDNDEKEVDNKLDKKITNKEK